MCDKLKSAILAVCLVVPAFGAFSGSGGDYLAEFNLYPFMGEYDTYDPDAFDQTFARLFYDIMTDGNPYLWNAKIWAFEQGLCFPSAWYFVDNDQGYVYSETRDVRFELFTKVGRYVYEGLADYTDDEVDYHCNVLWTLQNVSHWHDSCILTCEPVGDGTHKDEWSILPQDLNILIKDALDLTGDGLEVKAVQNLGDGYPWFVQRHDAWRTQGDYGMQSGLCGQNGNSTLDFRRTGAEPVLMEFDVAILSESGELNLRMHAGDKIERETLLTGTSHGWRSFTRFVYEDYDSVSFEFKRGNEDLRLDKINTALVDNLRVTKAIRIVFDPSWGGFKSGVRSEIWSIPGCRYGEFYPFPGESDLTPPRRDVGYVFEGWYADAEHIYDPIFDGKRKNGTGELITESTVVPVDISPTKVITLYARWSISPPPPPPHNPDPDPDEPDPDPEPEPSPDPAPNPGPDEPEPEPDPEPNPGFVRVDSQDENLILRSLSPLKGDKFSTEFSPGDRLFVDICIEVTSGGLPTRHRGPIDIEFVLSNGKVFSSVIKDGVNRELDKGYTLFKSLNLAPGDYTLTCRLDPEDKVKELTKSDNVLTVAFKVVPAWCNLVFGSADHIWTDLNKAGMAIGTSTLPLDFTDKVASTDDVYCHFCFFNESLSAIHAKVVCAVEVFRNGESVWKDTKTYSSLYEGESVHEGIHLNDVLALTPGSYTVKVSLDAEGVVAETDENDNVKICSFEVRPAASFRPVGGFHPTRAETMRGALFRLGEPIGIVELKIAKPKKNSSMAKVTGSLVGLDGKKKSIKGVCNLVSEYALYQRSTIDLTLPNIGDFKLEVGENGFAGVQGDYVLETASVGGRLATSLNFFVAESFASDVPNVVRQRDGHQFLPYDGLPIIDKNGKWVIEKAAKIKYAKVAKSDPPVYALTGYANAVNLCGLKLSYTQKTGLFKGAFTVFLLDESAAKSKLKKVTTDVRGIVVNGAGYGTATCKKLHCESSVTVK